MNEVLYMQIRLFRIICQRHGLSSRRGNELFEKYGIWDYIEDCYELFHVSGDESIANEIDHVLQIKGAFA